MEPKKVLIIEDDPILSDILKFAFAEEKFEVDIANNGEEGLNKALTTNPDIILLDLLMPKMNGLQVLQGYKESEKEIKVPIIILSNLDNQTELQKAIDLGATTYFVKSNLVLQDLVKKVKEYISPNL